jgi:O-antigen/teichoic acid export membrane protein
MNRRAFPAPALSVQAEAASGDAVLDIPPPIAEGAAVEPAAHPSTGRSHSIWRSVRRDAILLGAGSAGIVLAQLGFRSILIAALLPAAYGRVSLILSFYNTAMIIGASGLPNSAAKYISVATPKADPMIARAVYRAAAWPTVVAAVIVAVLSGLVLRSPWSCLLAVVGLTSMVYSLVGMGILRGRGRIIPAASIMPVAIGSGLVLLTLAWVAGVTITPLSAFALYCAGNTVALFVGLALVASSKPHATPADEEVEPAHAAVPTSRQLLGFSMWLGIATIGITVIPLIMRFAAVFDSYATVAVVDVAIVLLGIPQRVGAVIVQAVIPHATRVLRDGHVGLTISRREHLVLVVPFTLAAGVLAFTPIVRDVFDALGRPTYARSGTYLALVLLAAPARVLYGLVEGMLVARGEARFMAFNAVSISAAASAAIVAIMALDHVTAAFVVFAGAWWAIYLSGLARIHRATSISAASVPESAPT